jgi:hypothetical protein
VGRNKGPVRKVEIGRAVSSRTRLAMRFGKETALAADDLEMNSRPLGGFLVRMY